jgi:hypothetical protein
MKRYLPHFLIFSALLLVSTLAQRGAVARVANSSLTSSSTWARWEVRVDSVSDDRSKWGIDDSIPARLLNMKLGC